MTTDYQPSLPYAGTSGWSGSATSEERAIRDDSSGVTAKRQLDVLGYLATFGAHGMTVLDLREITEWHHGQASSVLSTLHKVGKIARLTERRDRCHVYVLHEYVNGRETAPHGRRKPKVLTQGMVRNIVQDCIYEARNNGLTIGHAADEAAKQIMQIVEGHRG